MKIMTIEEILACEIPEGDYKDAMIILRRNHFPALLTAKSRKFLSLQEAGNMRIINDSICAAFTALWELATYSGPEEEDGSWAEGWENRIGRNSKFEQAILAAIQTVDRSITRERSALPNPKELADSFTLRELNAIRLEIKSLLPAPGDYVKKIYLDESIRLQSHYADLLNMQDGGQRIIFKNSDEWIKRLDALGLL